MRPAKRAVLLTTSSINDVRRSGGVISITGLHDVPVRNLIAISPRVYTAEVVQVVTVGSGGYTPVASVRYKLKLGNIVKKREGYQGEERVYSYTTPATLTDIGATAALQREFIHVQLIAAINLTADNDVVAVTLATGTGFTITDDASYYPYSTSTGVKNRRGASSVVLERNSDGSGWDNSIEYTLTTAAVYAFGLGQDLLDAKPVVNPNDGNLIGGDINAPLLGDLTDYATATAGQQYAAFDISSLQEAFVKAMEREM
jgi:hypothetical protein